MVFPDQMMTQVWKYLQTIASKTRSVPRREDEARALGVSSSVSYLPVALILVAGVVISVSAFYFVLRDQDKLEAVAFEQRAGIQVPEIQKGIDRNLELLEGIGSLFSVTEDVDRNAFRGFVRLPLSHHSDIQALEWIPRVAEAERTSYEEAARVDGFVDFRFTERQVGGQIGTRSQESEYFPVYYVEPLRGNEPAVGFDLASNPTRREALEKARGSGEAVATAKITLVQETGEQSGFLIFYSVYREGAPSGTPADRNEALLGFALGVFRIGDMVKAALQGSELHDINFFIFDESAPQGQRFLYFHSKAGDRHFVDLSMEQRRTTLSAGLHHFATLDVGGRRWSILSRPGSDYVGVGGEWEHWTVLLGGLVLTGLLAAFVAIRTRAEAEMRATTVSRDTLAVEVAQRRQTEEEVAAKNRDLETLLYVTSHDLREPLRAIENFSQMVSEEYAELLDERGKDFLSRVVRGAGRMDQLLEDIVMLSRAQRMKSTVEYGWKAATSCATRWTG